MRMLKITGFVVLAITVAGCIPEPRDLAGGREAPVLAYDQARGFFVDRTNLFYGSFHGSQVEYTSANGEAFLWYPGNAAILTGYWKVETGAAGASRICFSYGEATYNPATGRSGGGWQCASAREYVTRIVEARNGDYLGLQARRAAPFWLSRDKTTLDDLHKRMILSGA